MATAIDWACQNGQPRAMLTTFRDVVFNAPFYRRLGFTEVEAADEPTSLRHMLDRETALGHDRTKRVGMMMTLGTARV